ncbi:MAG: hypothetical protein U5J83_18795 [Bryobacterales bacterium]|nr:hypothetical protein [Bryobacterales bacterium]
MPHAYPSSLQVAYFKVTAHTPAGVAIGPIKIHKYRNSSHSDSDTSAAAGLALKEKIIGALRDRYKKIMGTTQEENIVSIPSTEALRVVRGPAEPGNRRERSFAPSWEKARLKILNWPSTPGLQRGRSSRHSLIYRRFATIVLDSIVVDLLAISQSRKA